MIFRRIPAWGTLAVLLLCWTTSAANACDKCKACDSKATKCCDNKGLLDALDVLAGKLHKNLKGKKKASCDTAPSCGCEAKVSCGCELKPSCGCEATPECGCEMHGRVSPMTVPMVPLQDAIKVMPAVPSQPAPVPLQDAPEVVPLPDTKVDPFRDDAASRIRKVPARTIQYRTDATMYGEKFDPQASTRRPRLSVNSTQVAELNRNASSRRPIVVKPVAQVAGRQALPSSSGVQQSPQVIPASAVRPISSAPRTKLPAQQASGYHNPLR